MRLGRALGLGLLLAAATLGGCGDDDDPPARPAATTTTSSGGIDLAIRYDDGAGKEQTALLTCRDSLQRAGGYLNGKAPVSELCAEARSIKQLLTTQPEQDRVCTQIYGGPEQARVTGTIDGKKVDRRFTRTNGCEIADFDAAKGLLQP